MSNDASERLKQFRAQNGGGAPSPRWAVVQLLVLVAGLAAIGALVVWRGGSGDSDPAAFAEGGLSDGQLRDYAVYLEEKKLPNAAIDAYEVYLAQTTLDDAARANICYSVGKLAIDAEDYERALAYLYQAEMLVPEGELSGEIDKKVVLCLDKLGRNVDLRRELRKRSAVKRTAEDVGEDETVLAEFAGEVFTNRDLDLEVEKLPTYLRESFNTPEKQAELLKNMVAQRLLLDKALRLELDSDPEIQDQLAEQRDAMIVQKLIENDVRANVRTTPADVERFYKAEPDRFTHPASVQVFVGKADTEQGAAALTEFPEKPVTVQKGAPIQGVPASPEAVEAIFAAEPGQTAGPIQIEDAWYVFRVASKTPERLLPFEEVRDQAARALQTQKQQEQFRVLIEETLKARDVRLHLDRLQQGQEEAAEAP